MQPSLTFEGAYSVGTSQRSKWWDNGQKKNPPPGNYNMPNFYDKQSSEKYKIGKSNRSTLGNMIDLRGIPEPGVYQHQQYVGKFEDRQNKLPPTKYTPNDKSSKKNLPQFSFGYKFPQEAVFLAPGPETYPREDVEDFKMRRTHDNWKNKQDKGNKFNTSSNRWKSISPTIGPGEYEHERRNQRRSPAFQFGNSEKISDLPADLKSFPGPGHFDPKPQYAKTNGFSLAQKLGTSLKANETDAPGPGAYQPTMVKTFQNIRIGTAPRGDLVDRESIYKPGPGQYNQDMLPDRKLISIGNSERPPLNSTFNIPGAGTYFPPSKSVEGPQYSMGAKLKEKKKQTAFFPGPGAYEPNSEFVKESSQEVGVKTSMRSNPVYSKFVNSGPGSYEIITEKPIGSKYSIGNGVRFRQNRNSYEPGPGSYDIGGTIGKIPNYLLLSKRKNQGLLDFQ